MGRNLGDVHREARAAQAGQMYAQKHYKWVMFTLFVRTWWWIIPAILVLFWYLTGRS